MVNKQQITILDKWIMDVFNMPELDLVIKRKSNDNGSIEPREDKTEKQE